ncbi:MAG: helix-turn-helix transcriptional regulator [Ahrensia sp.]|nr:helix-turn-helix transcriptional regulator [Ahrensia sp.]
MTVGMREFSELTSLIYGAALDEAKWDVFLERLAHTSGGVRTSMFGCDFETNTDLGARESGYDPDFMRSYHDYYFAKNAWADGLLAGTVGVPTLGRSICSHEELCRTEWYNDWVRPQEDILGGGGVVLFKENRRIFLIGGNIRSRDIDRLEEPWMELMALLAPHLRQAFEMMRTITGRALQQQAHAGAPGPVTSGCFAVTGDRRIVHADRAGEMLLESGDLLRRDLGGRLVLAQWSHERTFQDNLAAVAASELHHPVAFDLAGGDNETVHTCRIAHVMPGLLPYPGPGLLFGSDEPLFLVAVSSQNTTDRSPLDILGERYGLTAHEMKTVIRLADGLSPREIADERSVSIHTVRNQKKSAMTKMGVRSQIEIGRLVESLRR